MARCSVTRLFPLPLLLYCIIAYTVHLMPRATPSNNDRMVGTQPRVSRVANFQEMKFGTPRSRCHRHRGGGE